MKETLLSCLTLTIAMSALAREVVQDDTRPAALVWRGCGISKVAFMAACAEAYEKETGVSFRLSGGGATLGIEAAGSGGADLGGTCRGCLESLGEDQLDLNLTMVAWDALVVVTHPSNPVNSISKKQLVRVFRQEITNWKDLGGENRDIVVVTRQGKTSGVGFMVRKLIFEDAHADFGSRVIRLRSSGPVEELLERTPSAIALTGVSSARRRHLKVLGLDDVEPTAENIAAGRYRYFRPLYLAHSPEPTPEVREFLDWIVGPKGQQVIADQGSVNLWQGLQLTLEYRYFEDPGIITNLADLRQKARAAQPGK